MPCTGARGTKQTNDREHPRRGQGIDGADLARPPSMHRTWLLVLLVTVACHAPSFRWRFLDGDEGTYATIATLLDDGGRLYEDGGVDNKFPGIYYTYAAVFRVCGRYAMQAVHALALLAVLATAALLLCITDSWLAALFYGVFTTVYYPKMMAANTELFMMLPLTAAMLLALRGRTFAAGAL